MFSSLSEDFSMWTIFKRNNGYKIISKIIKKKIMPWTMWFLKSSFLIKAQWFWVYSAITKIISKLNLSCPQFLTKWYPIRIFLLPCIEQITSLKTNKWTNNQTNLIFIYIYIFVFYSFECTLAIIANRNFPLS